MGVYSLTRSGITNFVKYSTFLAGNRALNYWMALLGDTGEVAENGIVDSSNNPISVGGTGTDALIVKWASNGDVTWQRKLSSANSEAYLTVAADSSDNIIAAGYSNVSGTTGGNLEWLVAKYNSSGTIQWQRRYSNDSGNYRDLAAGVVVDSSGNVYAAGSTSDNFTRNPSIVKWDSSGTIQWQRRIVTNGDNDEYYQLAIDSSSNLYAIGYARNSNNNASAFLVVKYDSSGNLTWQRRLQASGAETIAESAAIDSSGNIYVLGYSIASGLYDFQIAKYNSSGAVQWQRRLGNAGNSYGLKISVSSTNDVYVIGYTDVSGTNDIQLAKYNSSGTIQWQRRINTSGSDIGTSISTDAAGNVYVYGYTNASTNNKMFVAKLPADGSLTGTYSLGGASFTYAASTSTDASTSLVENTPTFTSSDPSYTEGSLSLTDSATTLTDVVIFV